jgi:hypothetical protein
MVDNDEGSLQDRLIRQTLREERRRKPDNRPSAERAILAVIDTLLEIGVPPEEVRGALARIYRQLGITPPARDHAADLAAARGPNGAA